MMDEALRHSSQLSIRNEPVENQIAYDAGVVFR